MSIYYEVFVSVSQF